MSCHITYLPSGIRQAAKVGDNVYTLAAKAGVMIEGSCGGKGTCGKCKIIIVSGETPPPDAAEVKGLSEAELADGYRLACRLQLVGNLEIMVPQLCVAAVSRKSKLNYMPEDYIHSHKITKYLIKLPQASLADQRSDTQRLLELLPSTDFYFKEHLLLRQLQGVLAQGTPEITVVTEGKKIIAIEAGDTLEKCYGIAFDLGTTTVVGMMWDLNKSKLLGVVARANPQGTHGADVISRINYSAESPENLAAMQEKIIHCCNQIVSHFCHNFGIVAENIYSGTVVGNTTMSHLFLGVNPAQLAQAPFAPVFCRAIDCTATSLGMHISPWGEMHLMSNIAGHVGSDITGVILATRLDEKEGLSLAIDVGTNGEIVLAKDGEMLVCSTAAGPAFEGAAIHQGMRAATGAIESVCIAAGEVELEVIDEVTPCGICGSGLVDAVAELLKIGIIDYTGKMLDKATALAKGIDEKVAQRLETTPQNGNHFILYTDGNQGNVVLTQKDVREVQLAKGAIYAGIITMINELGSKIADIDRIIIAGAFGNYIKRESALRVGLFPAVDPEKIISVGNAAGAGSCLALLSEDERSKALALARMARHVELAGRADFQQIFMESMYFPVSELS
jgi:uncharacterized 2Fe-2S/4Fe-4S cluster protein (DUF4445 family)